MVGFNVSRIIKCHRPPGVSSLGKVCITTRKVATARVAKRSSSGTSLITREQSREPADPETRFSREVQASHRRDGRTRYLCGGVTGRRCECSDDDVAARVMVQVLLARVIRTAWPVGGEVDWVECVVLGLSRPANRRGG